MNNVFFISDLHLGHFNIIEYANRPFISTMEMDKTLIKNWNKTIKATDKVFILGDFSFHNKEKTATIVEKLNGKKVLILGNHDRARSFSWWKAVGFQDVYEFPIIYKNKYILSHEPFHVIDNNNHGLFNVHGHLHNHKGFYNETFYYNVGVEVNEYKPINFLYIEKYFKDKIIEENYKKDTFI